MTRVVFIGAGAGFAGDRVDPVVDLEMCVRLNHFVFECLAERTMALAQTARLHNPAPGYDPLLETRMRVVLPAAKRSGTRIVTNIGTTNPIGAARLIAAIAAELGLVGLRVAAVDGNDVLQIVRAPLPLADLALTTDDLHHGGAPRAARLGRAAVRAPGCARGKGDALAVPRCSQQDDRYAVVRLGFGGPR